MLDTRARARLLTARERRRSSLFTSATDSGGDAETVNTLRQAAKGASNRGAPDVAVTYLQRALAEPPSPELEPQLVHELGKAALSAGKLEIAIEQLGRATRDFADGPLRAKAANALGSALFLANRPEEAMTDLTAVIDELPEGEREQGLRLQATRWVAVRGALRSGVVSRQPGSGSSSRPVGHGRSGSGCRSQ